MLVSLLVGGFFSDRFGRRIVWYCGGDLVLLATWIMIFPQSFVVFIVCRVFIGIGSGIQYIR
jgi:MFS family permease